MYSVKSDNYQNWEKRKSVVKNLNFQQCFEPNPFRSYQGFGDLQKNQYLTAGANQLKL